MIAILSDIHSNLEALKTILSHLESIDQIWHLGDIVGYGPNPNECLNLIRQKKILSLIGNHDLASLGKMDTAFFNPYARWAVEWTEEVLTGENKKFLAKLPLVLNPLSQVTLVHGSPRDPVWEYIFDLDSAEENFSYFESALCFVGHSHIPFLVEKTKARCFSRLIKPNIDIVLNRNLRYIINVGAVGQPRDGDPRGSYIEFDPQRFTIQFRRLAYPVEKTQEKMKKLGFPDVLITRLVKGQ